MPRRLGSHLSRKGLERRRNVAAVNDSGQTLDREGALAPARSHGAVKPMAPLLRYEVILTCRPGIGDSIIKPPPITIPTWPGALGVPSPPTKNTRSPGCTWLAGTLGPHCHCSCEVRGMKMPAVR